MSYSAQVKILDKRIGKDANYPLPSRGSADSAGMDLIACIDEPLTIKAGETVLVNTGLAIYLKDPNLVGLIYPRSGLGNDHGIVLGNLVGVIDADYQGELKVSLWNRSAVDYTVSVGERIAQYVVTPVIVPTLEFVEDFSDTSERGTGGFGSTGK